MKGFERITARAVGSLHVLRFARSSTDVVIEADVAGRSYRVGPVRRPGE